VTLRILLPLAAIVLALPALGLALTGEPVWPRILDFPPREGIEHQAFSWPVFIALTALIAGAIAPVLRWIYLCPAVVKPAPRPFPWWGWMGVAGTAIIWWLAWHRYAWFSDLQAWTFTPLWLGYVVIMSALSYARAGRCSLLDRPSRYLLLFAASAVFWWLFEYLNHFVRNWYYAGIEGFSGFDYFWFASLPYSTVLPAVLATFEWLWSFPRLTHGLKQRATVRLARPRAVAGATLGLSCALLLGIGVWPDALFGFVWVAPFTALLALQALHGEPTVLIDLARGDWRIPIIAALAGLVCGMFWELWNSGSLAHWRYSIAFVQRFAIFEMPLLGYAGYLPFGVGCVAVARLLMNEAPARTLPDRLRRSAAN
jgi:hypothetical protein